MKIGSHVRKLGSFGDTVSHYDGSMPIQLFTGSTKTWNRNKFQTEDLCTARNHVKKMNLKLYIHSIYLINLSRPSKDIFPAIFSLVYDLFIGRQIGASGVVIHVGKYVDMKPEMALKNMYDNIISILPYIHKECPLLIETPAGQGTELLVKREDFIAFYEQFTPLQRKKIKICVDTCHVFASGYNPLEYLKDVYDKHSESLVLVHYNDSQCVQGSCKDRHAPPGFGHIGKKMMDQIEFWCNERDLPMVVE